MKKFFKAIWRLIVGLLTDKGLENGDSVRKLSLGRIAFLVLFALSISMWAGNKDIPQNMMVTMGALLTYVFGTKVTTGFFPGSNTTVNIGTSNPYNPQNPEDEHGD